MSLYPSSYLVLGIRGNFETSKQGHHPFLAFSQLLVLNGRENKLGATFLEMPRRERQIYRAF